MQRNMTIMKMGLLGLTLSAFLLSAAAGYAQEEGHEEWQAEKAKMYEQLGLTAQQKQALESHKEGHRREMKGLRDTIKEKRKAFREALANPNADEALIRSLDNEIKSLKDQLDEKRLNGILEVRKILTPEQFKQFNELKKERRGKKRGGKK